jgi:hypothetical protein
MYPRLTENSKIKQEIAESEEKNVCTKYLHCIPTEPDKILKLTAMYV